MASKSPRLGHAKPSKPTAKHCCLTYGDLRPGLETSIAWNHNRSNNTYEQSKSIITSNNNRYYCSSTNDTKYYSASWGTSALKPLEEPLGPSGLGAKCRAHGRSGRFAPTPPWFSCFLLEAIYYHTYYCKYIVSIFMSITMIMVTMIVGIF